MKNYSSKTAKGYRLKPETHNLIKSLQELTRNDADEVLNASCMMYLSYVAGKISRQVIKTRIQKT